MGKSPGHRKWPEHKVEEVEAPEPMRVTVDGQVVAESDAVVRVDEDDKPARFYFPRDAVKMELLEPSETTTHCPFKGEARYFHLRAGGKMLEDAVWTYEDPYDEHQGLRERLAFYDDKLPELEVATLH